MLLECQHISLYQVLLIWTDIFDMYCFVVVVFILVIKAKTDLKKEKKKKKTLTACKCSNCFAFISSKFSVNFECLPV